MTSRRRTESHGEDPPDYRITYFDPVAAESGFDTGGQTAHPDGGLSMQGTPTTFALAMETRERVAAVESSVESIEGSVNRIETTVDEVAEEVSDVDDAALDAERFEDRYKQKILRNWRFWTVLKWAAAALTTALLIVGSFLQAGVL